MSDPKWKERLYPVMSDAVTALSGLLSGDLFDKLLERECVNDEKHERLIKARRDHTSNQSDVARDLLMMLKCRPHPSFSNFCSVIEKVDGGSDLLHILTPSAKESHDDSSTKNFQGSPDASLGDKDEDDILNIFVVERLKEAYEPYHKSVVSLVKDIIRATEKRSKELIATVSYLPSIPFSSPGEKQVGRHFVISDHCKLQIFLPRTKPEYFEKRKKRLLGVFSSLLNYTSIEILKENCHVILTLKGTDFVSFLCDLQDRICLFPFIEFDPDVEIQFSCFHPFKLACLLRQKNADLQGKIDKYNQQSRKQFTIIRAQIQDKQRLEAEKAFLAKKLRKESSDKTELSAQLIALQKTLREKEETIELHGKRNEESSERLHDELRKVRFDLESQLCDEREGRRRDNDDAVREKMRVGQRLEAEKAFLADKLERERSEKAGLSAELVSLRKTLKEKEETIEQQKKQNDAYSERLHGELRKLRTDLESQLRDEKEERLNAVREKMRVEQRLKAEKAALADQLERERNDRAELSAELIALRETLKEKEETIELQQKKNDADSERLHGELRKLEMDRDELTFQLRNEREGQRSLQVEVASLADQLERENNDKKELSSELIALRKTLREKEESIGLQLKQANKDLEKLDGEVRKLRTDRDDLGRQLHEEKELRHREQQDAARERSNAVQRLQKQLEDMKERHRIETNGLKADVAAKAAALRQQRDKSLFLDAQKRLAENSQVEKISDPNRPSEVAKRYGDLFQHTYDVAEVLEEKDIEYDECISFLVEMLMISSRAAESSLSEYETANAKANGLNESFLKKNPTAKRILKESVTSLLRLASAASREENSKRITEIALREIQESYPKYYSQETAPTIEKFLSSSSSVVWEVVIFARPADFVLNDTTFDEAVHERFHGSDPKSDKIRFIVWPRLAEQVTGKTLCKGKVVTGE